MIGLAVEVDVRRSAWASGGGESRRSRTGRTLLDTIRIYSSQPLLFLPGAIVGGVVGWFIIRPVNWVLGDFFRGFNWVFDRRPTSTARPSAGHLRLSAIVLLDLCRPDRPDGLRLHAHSDRLHSQSRTRGG